MHFGCSGGCRLIHEAVCGIFWKGTWDYNFEEKAEEIQKIIQREVATQNVDATLLTSTIYCVNINL